MRTTACACGKSADNNPCCKASAGCGGFFIVGRQGRENITHQESAFSRAMSGGCPSLTSKKATSVGSSGIFQLPSGYLNTFALFCYWPVVRTLNLHGSQQFIVGSLFGWKRGDGTRRYRVASSRVRVTVNRHYPRASFVHVDSGWRKSGTGFRCCCGS